MHRQKHLINSITIEDVEQYSWLAAYEANFETKPMGRILQRYFRTVGRSAGWYYGRTPNGKEMIRVITDSEYYDEILMEMVSNYEL